MSTRPFTRIAATGLLAATLVSGAVTPSPSATLPVSSVQQIAGLTPTQQVRWWGGWGWRGYGWGWRRPNYGAAIAAGAIAGGILGLAAASAPYYGYGYPAYYGYYPRRTIDLLIMHPPTIVTGLSIIAVPTGGRSTIAGRTDRSTIAGPTGGRSTTDVPTTGHTSTAVRVGSMCHQGHGCRRMRHSDSKRPLPKALPTGG